MARKAKKSQEQPVGPGPLLGTICRYRFIERLGEEATSKSRFARDTQDSVSGLEEL